MASSNSRSLVKRSLSALKWGYVGVAARIVMQIASQIVLARLLGPAAYGVVTAAILIILIAGIVAELGVAVSIVQMRQVQPRDLRIAFTRVAGFALLVATCIVATADLVGQLFNNPGIAPVLRWMSLAVVFQVLGAVSLGLLKRNLDFKSIQIGQMVSYFVGFFVVGITSAVLGAGEWSLVAAWLTQTALATIIQFIRAPHSVLPAVGRTSEPLFEYGSRTVVASLANWGIENVDNFMVGRAFGTTTLGAYAISYNLVRTPVNHLVFSIQQVFHPFMARTRDDPETGRKAYLMLVWSVLLVTTPAFLGIGAISATAIEALYGPAWSLAAPLLVPLAMAMPLQALQAVGGPVLWGSGQVSREIAVSLSVLVMLLGILYFASYVSAVAMAWGVWTAYLIRSLWITATASRIVGLRMSHTLRMLVGALTVGPLTAICLFGADWAMTLLGVPALLRLLAAMALGAAVAPLVAYAFGRRIVPAELRGFLGPLVARVPARIREHVKARFGIESAGGPH